MRLSAFWSTDRRPASLIAPQEVQHLNRAGSTKLGIKEVDDGIWLVSFMHYDLGYIDLEQRTLQTIDNPFGTRLSPMSQGQSVTLLSGPDSKRMVSSVGFEPTTP